MEPVENQLTDKTVKQEGMMTEMEIKTIDFTELYQISQSIASELTDDGFEIKPFKV